MYLSKKTEDGMMVGIIVRFQTEQRLRKTCFRGVTVRKAGNFSCWNHSEQVLMSGVVLKEFLAEITELWKRQDFGTHSVEIECDYFVGWSSTAPLGGYILEVLEPFKLNRRSEGLRVKYSRRDLRAPQTKLLTIVFEFKSEDGRPVVVIHSMYLGKDVGELEGDVTAREDCVFFDWEHPGA